MGIIKWAPGPLGPHAPFFSFRSIVDELSVPKDGPAASYHDKICGFIQPIVVFPTHVQGEFPDD